MRSGDDWRDIQELMKVSWNMWRRGSQPHYSEQLGMTTMALGYCFGVSRMFCFPFRLCFCGFPRLFSKLSSSLQLRELESRKTRYFNHQHRHHSSALVPSIYEPASTYGTRSVFTRFSRCVHHLLVVGGHQSDLIRPHWSCRSATITSRGLIPLLLSRPRATFAEPHHILKLVTAEYSTATAAPT